MIIPYLWRHLPGPLPIRLLLTAVVILGVVALCFQVVFPLVSTLLRIDDGVTG